MKYKACPNHKPVQHRDSKPPWCSACGWSSPRPALDAVKQSKIVKRKKPEND